MQPFYLLKRSFVRQSRPDDCGLACLAMIFHYSGKTKHVPELRTFPVKKGGLSLLELRNLAAEFLVPCQCVEMEITYLRKITAPCILHMITEFGENHFQVCYGSKRFGKQICYLMADPAKQFYYLEEKTLLRHWRTRTALFFEDLKPDLAAFKHSAWNTFWSFHAYPRGILLSVPLLSIFGASFSVALSWLLQKGISNDVLLGRPLIFILLTLLLTISLFRSGIAFVRQFLLIRINLFQQAHLSQKLFDRIFNPFLLTKGYPSNKTVKDNLGDIQRIVSATSNFIAVLLSDGALVITMICAIAFYLPWAALVNLLYLAFVTVLLIRRLAPASHAALHLSYFAGASESIVLKDIDRLQELEKVNLLEERKKIHLVHLELQLRYARSFAFKTGKFIFLIEALGTINVVAVFTICLYQLNRLMLSYSDLMITVMLSYISSSLIPKISGAMMSIADGADASIQLKATL